MRRRKSYEDLEEDHCKQGGQYGQRAQGKDCGIFWDLEGSGKKWIKERDN